MGCCFDGVFLFGCSAVVWCNDRPRNWHRLPVQRPPIGAGRIDDDVSCYMLLLPLLLVWRDICFCVVTGGHRRWLLLHPSARDAVRQIQDGSVRVLVIHSQSEENCHFHLTWPSLNPAASDQIESAQPLASHRKNAINILRKFKLFCILNELTKIEFKKKLNLMNTSNISWIYSNISLKLERKNC